MKKLFLSLVVLMAATVSFAQNSLVATLSHGEDVSMYYGTYALCDAHNAAVSGDVINLSGGAFQAVNITKGITLRGTGIDDTAPTYIIGDFTINVTTDDANRLSMEGIRCTGTITMQGTFDNPYFVKSAFYGFSYHYSSTNIKNAMFVDCRISGGYTLRGMSTVQFINSYVGGFQNESETSSTAAFINCVIRPYESISSYSASDRYSFPSYIRSSQLLNCIIFYEKYGNQVYQLPSSTVATNCISINYNNLFGQQTANKGNGASSFAAMFKSFTGTYSEAEQFELTDEAKTSYLGNDGTEVGMHGGVMPYNTTPSYPQITKMNVANKTTADGKLSVEIEVSAAE